MNDQDAALIVTGADRTHFVNSKLLLASWWEHNRSLRFVYCDFGLTAEQRAEVMDWPVLLRAAPPAAQGAHPWLSKSMIGDFIADLAWKYVIWIDADAVFLRPLPPLDTVMDGYDLLIDPHPKSVGEIAYPATVDALRLEGSDAYFSSGFWITSSRDLLRRWKDLTHTVLHYRRNWENDAFVAAIYQSRARIRPVSGHVWHARTNTSAATCQLIDGVLTHAGVPIYVLHANSGFTVRSDGRRVFDRQILRDVQDRYELAFAAAAAEWPRQADPASNADMPHRSHGAEEWS